MAFDRPKSFNATGNTHSAALLFLCERIWNKGLVKLPTVAVSISNCYSQKVHVTQWPNRNLSSKEGNYVHYIIKQSELCSVVNSKNWIGWILLLMIFIVVIIFSRVKRYQSDLFLCKIIAFYINNTYVAYFFWTSEKLSPSAYEARTERWVWSKGKNS